MWETTITSNQVVRESTRVTTEIVIKPRTTCSSRSNPLNRNLHNIIQNSTCLWLFRFSCCKTKWRWICTMIFKVGNSITKQVRWNNNFLCWLVCVLFFAGAARWVVSWRPGSCRRVPSPLSHHFHAIPAPLILPTYIPSTVSLTTLNFSPRGEH